MKFKKILRIMILLLMIALASVLPVPLIFYKKYKKPQFFMEQIDKKKEGVNEDVKELY